MTGADGWWRGGNALARYMTDLIDAEAKCLRPGGGVVQTGQLAHGAWRPELQLAESGAGFDSLERLHLAGALSSALHMHESGVADDLLARTTYGDWHAIATASLERFSALITMRSSGSTGAPSCTPHRLRDLAAEVALLADLLAAGRRVLSAVPSHHIYGFLLTILLPHLRGLPVRELRDHSPAALAALLCPGDVVIAHPVFWAAVARALPAFPAGVIGVSSAAPCAPETVGALRAAGLSRMIEIHGASELAGIGWREDPHAPYTLMPHWRRGRVGMLRRNTVDNDIDLALPDALEWVDARRYRLGGRHDGAVQVGGVNVYPRRVAAVLCRHSGVAEAAVRLMTPAEGERLKAFIVARDPAADRARLRAELERWAAGELPSAEQPRAYDFGPALPTGTMGKAADWPIRLSSPAAADPA